MRRLLPLLLAACAATEGPEGPAGAPGEDGLDGADGSLRIYGDGSAGSLVVEAGEGVTLDAANLQFSDVRIDGELVVPSGAVLRVAGDATIGDDGQLIVGTMVRGGDRFNPPDAGVAIRGAMPGAFGDPGNYHVGGSGGVGLGPSSAPYLLHLGPHGGGGGAGYGGVGDGAGGAGYGGGTLTWLVQGTLTLDGEMAADGRDAGGGNSGAGGGGGGVIVLGSPTAIAVAGRISATGGDGDDASTVYGAGAGGGGGGGLVHLIAPEIDNFGTVDVSGGVAGATVGAIDRTIHFGGGGGGACIGNGGKGGDVNRDDETLAAESGSDGQALFTQVDPTSLF